MNNNFRDFLVVNNSPSTQPGSWVNYFGNGGKVQPYITNNPNDPRIRKYQDSLNVYNKHKKEVDNFMQIVNQHNLAYTDDRYMYDKNGKNELSSYRNYGKPQYTYKEKGISPEKGYSVVTNNNEKYLTKNGDYITLDKKIQNDKYGSSDAMFFKKPVRPIIYKKPEPQNTNFNVNVNGGFSTPEDYVEPAVEQIPIQQTQAPQDFRKYMHPKGYSRQGQSGERQSESFYDANGKMTGQVVNGQYIPTEYGKFLQSGMSEDEYLNSVQEFGNGGEKTTNTPKWAQNINVDSKTSGGYPAWWLSTKKMSPERKQQHFNAIVNNMLDDGYELTDIPMVMNDIVGYGEDERDRQEFNPTLGFDKGDIDSLLKNYNPNNFRNGGEFSNGGQYDAVINAAEQKYRLPAGLLHRVARTESQYNPNAYNKGSKAAGMFQIVPGTAKELGIDPYDVNQAADAAGKYLSQLIKQTGSVEDALRAYNFGIGNVQKWKQGKKALPLETQQYVGKVLGGNSVPSIGGGLGKYFNQIEQDLSWRSREIDQELEDEEIPQYSQEEAVSDNVEEEDEETTTEEQTQSIQDEYLPLEELSKLMTASRRNDFLDIVFANTAPSIEEDQYQYYG